MKPLFSPINNEYWVYITQNNNTNSRQIEYTVDLNIKLHRIKDAAIIYYRSFDNATDALTHKLLLEKLPFQSVNSIIRKMNPRMQELSFSYP